MRIHPVFNVSLLKPYKEATDIPGHVPETAPPPPQVTAQGDMDVVEKLVNRRTFITDGEKLYYYRVKWVGYPSSKNTWEPELQLREDGLGDHIDDYDARYPRELAPKTRGGRRS
jgi:hypothetical protein